MKKVHYADRYLLNPYYPVIVFVIGVGGIGSQVTTSLAQIGATLQALGHPGLHMTIFDPDTVTEANVGRQLLGESGLELNRTTALVARINHPFGFSWEAEGQRRSLKVSTDWEESAPVNIIITCTGSICPRMNL